MTSRSQSQFGQALCFQPSADLASLDRSLDYVPRYLFRAYIPRSNGSTTATAVVAPAANRSRPYSPTPEGDIDLLQLPREKAASILWNHLEWKNQPDDNLMSWTSSLFFAIQHGLYRRHKDGDRPALSEVRICVVDTRKFPRGAFVKDLDLMKAYVDNKDIGLYLKLRLGKAGYYYGEYLSQGRLDIENRSRHTSIGLLVELGLYDVEPRFQDKQDILAKRVVELRQPFKLEPRINCPASKSLVRKAITMAQGALGDELALPFALTLLSLCPRPKNDGAILAGFAATFTDEEILTLSLPAMKIDGERLPEVQQFADLVRDLNRHVAPEGSGINPEVVDEYYEIDDVVSSMSQLTVSQASQASPAPRARPEVAELPAHNMSGRFNGYRAR